LGGKTEKKFNYLMKKALKYRGKKKGGLVVRYTMQKKNSPKGASSGWRGKRNKGECTRTKTWGKAGQKEKKKHQLKKRGGGSTCGKWADKKKTFGTEGHRMQTGGEWREEKKDLLFGEVAESTLTE